MTTATLSERRVADTVIRRAPARGTTTEPYTKLEGLAVPYGVAENVGWYREEFAPGAFGKSVREAAAALPLLLFHESRSWPIGKATGWAETEAGLFGTWQLDDSAEAQRAAEYADKELLTGLSVGFVPVRSEWTELPEGEDDDSVFGEQVTRTEARLVEVSLVPAPAYDSARVTLVRTARRRDPRRGVPPARRADEWRRFLADIAEVR